MTMVLLGQYYYTTILQTILYILQMTILTILRGNNVMEYALIVLVHEYDHAVITCKNFTTDIKMLFTLMSDC